MKKILLSLAVVLLAALPFAVNAQQLTVEYETRVNANSPDAMKDAGLPDEMRKALVSAVAHVKAGYVLCIDGGQVEGRAQAAKEKQMVNFMGQTFDANEFVKNQLENIIYFNKDTKRQVSKVVVMGKHYLLVDPLKPDTFDVKPNEKKDILGYECVKAVSKDGKQTIWFTKHIPVDAGPLYTDVGGLILEAELKDYIFVAKKISMSVDHALKEPTGGEEMTEKAFKEKMQKYVEMMRRGQ